MALSQKQNDFTEAKKEVTRPFISRCARRALVVFDRALPGGRFQRGGTISGRLRLQRQQRFGTGPFRARLYGHYP